ncbi:MAG: excisionase family protein [Gallionella sp.]|nr:excisionase family protein [Gallionella sp.]
MKWVLVKKVVEIIGYTEDAIRAKMRKGVWLKGIHWTKAPDNRIHFNIEAIQQWIEGSKA